MKKISTSNEPYGFKYRKIVHYSLILCILFIQLLIAAFFYNEFVKDKKLAFFEKQLGEINTLERLTEKSRVEFSNAQGSLQKFMTSKDEKDLNAYFSSLRALDANLSNINLYENKFPKIKEVHTKSEEDFSANGNLKKLIDSTQKYSSDVNLNMQNDLPNFKKFDLDYNFAKYMTKISTS